MLVFNLNDTSVVWGLLTCGHFVSQLQLLGILFLKTVDIKRYISLSTIQYTISRWCNTSGTRLHLKKYLM